MLDYNILDVKKTGKHKMKCPSCIDKRSNKNDPSLYVAPHDKYAICFYCGTVYNDLSEKQVREVHYELPTQDWQNFTEISDNAIKYINSRGISQMTAIEEKVTEEEYFIPKDSKKMNCIVFNYFSEGRLISKKYRSGSKGFAQSKNTAKVFYRHDKLYEHSQIIVTFGEFDALSAVEVGYDNVLSAPNGDSDLALFKEDLEVFNRKEKIILACDNDPSGKESVKKVIDIIGAENVYIVQYPDGCKDLNDIHVKFGNQAVKNAIEKAVSYVIINNPDIIMPIDIMDKQADDFFNDRYDKPVTIGLGDYGDSRLVFRKNCLSFVLAKSSVGKSTIATWMLYKLAVMHDWKIIMAYFENTPAMVRVQLISYHLGTNAKGVYGNGKENEKRYAESAKWVDAHFLFINSTISINLDELLSIAGANKDYDLLVIDPLNVLGKIPGHYSDYSMHEYQAAKLLSFSRKTMSVMVNVHPPSAIARSKDRLELNDLQFGILYSSKADIFITFHRDTRHPDITVRDTTEIDVLKVRDQEIFGGAPTDDENSISIRFNGYAGFRVIEGQMNIELEASDEEKEIIKEYKDVFKKDEDEDDCPF